MTNTKDTAGIAESNRIAREQWAKRIAAGHRVEQQDAALREMALKQFAKDNAFWRRFARIMGVRV